VNRPAKPVPKCFECGSPAEFYCDAPVSLDPKAPIDHPDRLRLCNRPLCSECRVNKGTAFACGETGCHVESVDYCRPCDTRRQANWRVIPGRHIANALLVCGGQQVLEGNRVRGDGLGQPEQLS
jgi:hypothetical protein